MTDGNSTSKAENERQYAVIDQMLTMHSSLRDRMDRWAFWLNTALIGLSLFLTVFAFVGDDLLAALGFEPVMTRFVLGLATVAVLLCSITEFRVDWRSTAGKHDEAAARLGELKAKYRKSYTETNGEDTKRNARLTSEYEAVMGSLPAIPDRWFNTLKADHQFKRVLSQNISHYPKTPVWFLRTKLRLEGMLEGLRRKKESQ